MSSLILRNCGGSIELLLASHIGGGSRQGCDYVILVKPRASNVPVHSRSTGLDPGTVPNYSSYEQVLLSSEYLYTLQYHDLVVAES